MKIGDLALNNPLILAPMAGITQLPFRRLAKEAGCALVVTEMVSANGLVHGSKKTSEFLISHPCERPLSAQIFGADPDVMKEAAQIVESVGADLLDINLGCSVRKIIRQGSGAALMREPDRLEAVLKAIRSAVDLPLTVKMRTGWEPSGQQAVKAARIAEYCGVDAVAIHPRTAVQGFSGKADWSLIARLKESVAIPVIGNGDIQQPEDVLKMQQETGCDGVMIGRASIGNPWIFAQALDLIRSRPYRRPGPSERLNATLRYIDYSVNHFGEDRAVRIMRSRLCWFTKGLPHSSRFRAAIVRLKTGHDMMDAVRAYFQGEIRNADIGNHGSRDWKSIRRSETD
ncbi:MAG: tRNA dihydrouridine synthase DusB [Desulfobacterales bacterium S3730MH5]|nr:MAG: tRNA dihydrouridine synthase DusB [Desulfobacterales bacterium S3730MH5]